jgi:hypothetical protein
MTRRHLLATLAAACHLGLVVCGASKLVFWGQPSQGSPPRAALRLYGALSGAENGYAFFAPGIGPQVRVTFTLTDAAGRTWTDTLDRGMTREGALRVGSGVALASEPAYRDDLFRSWAGAMFGRHPDARKVTVRLQEYDPPTMAEYRAGVRPRWETIDEATADRDELTP